MRGIISPRLTNLRPATYAAIRSHRLALATRFRVNVSSRDAHRVAETLHKGVPL